MQIVEDSPAVHEEIFGVLVDAFGQDGEAKLVDELRREGDLTVSLAAESGGFICGYVALSRLYSPANALALAPVAVLKAAQRAGVGSALVRCAIERAQALGSDVIFVLGDPRFYTRFGFSTESAAGFLSPYTGPHFLALRLTQREVAPAPVVYASAFEKLG